MGRANKITINIWVDPDVVHKHGCRRPFAHLSIYGLLIAHRTTTSKSLHDAPMPPPGW
jgi:hypothetical protein